MKNKHILLLLFIALSSPVIHTFIGQDYTLASLRLDVFPDRSLNVEIVIEPDPALARVNTENSWLKSISFT